MLVGWFKWNGLYIALVKSPVTKNVKRWIAPIDGGYTLLENVLARKLGRSKKSSI
jgi:hypothetical protein